MLRLNKVDSKCYTKYVVPELTQFYNKQRVKTQARMGLEGSTHPDNQPLGHFRQLISWYAFFHRFHLYTVLPQFNRATRARVRRFD